jgi:regulator of sigma D
MYNEIKRDYIYPQHQVSLYQNVTGTKNQPTDNELFEQLYEMNKSSSSIPGHQTGYKSANLFNIHQSIQKIEQAKKAGTLTNEQAEKMKQRRHQDTQGIVKFVDPLVMRQIKNDYSLENMLERSNPLQEKYFDLTR